MDKKYILLQDDTCRNSFSIIPPLYRIQAIRNFGKVKSGNLGGYIEKESNLSHEGNCWVSGDAKIYDGAQVFGNAQVYGNARVYDNARVYGNACIFGSARVFDSAKIYDNTSAFDSVRICDKAEVYAGSCISGVSRISGVMKINKTENVLNVGPIGSRNSYTTFVKSDNGIIYASCNCFFGTIDEFEKRVLETYSENSIHRKNYLNSIEYARNILINNLIY